MGRHPQISPNRSQISPNFNKVHEILMLKYHLVWVHVYPPVQVGQRSHFPDTLWWNSCLVDPLGYNLASEPFPGWVEPLPRLWETLQFGQMPSPFVNKEMVLFISESLSGLFLPCLKSSAFSQVNASSILSYKSLKPEFFFLPSHLLPFLFKGQFSC